MDFRRVSQAFSGGVRKVGQAVVGAGRKVGEYGLYKAVPWINKVAGFIETGAENPLLRGLVRIGNSFGHNKGTGNIDAIAQGAGAVRKITDGILKLRDGENGGKADIAIGLGKLFNSVNTGREHYHKPSLGKVGQDKFSQKKEDYQFQKGRKKQKKELKNTGYWQGYSKAEMEDKWKKEDRKRKGKK